jgi:hypothetical protein
MLTIYEKANFLSEFIKSNIAYKFIIFHKNPSAQYCLVYVGIVVARTHAALRRLDLLKFSSDVAKIGNTQ